MDGNASAEVRALMNDVNAKRKSKYQDIASLKTVELITGQKAIEKLKQEIIFKLPLVGKNNSIIFSNKQSYYW